MFKNAQNEWNHHVKNNKYNVYALNADKYRSTHNLIDSVVNFL